MAKNKWTEYIIEYLWWTTKQPFKKPQFFTNSESRLTTVLKKAVRVSLWKATKKQKELMRNYIRTRIIPINCELGESEASDDT